MAIPIPKTLLIGLGGFGKATLRTLRRKIYENYGFHEIPALEYLVLDTDRDPNALMYKKAFDSLDRHVAFTPAAPRGGGEFIDLSCDRQALEDLYRGNLTPQVKSALTWFDERLKDLGSKVLEDGAGGIRSLGKLSYILALLHGNQHLTEIIQHKLREINDLSGPPDPRWDKVSNYFTLDESEDKVNIYFFCSTAGGTGAGMFLDMAYLIRGLFTGRGIDYSSAPKQGDIVLYLYLPDIILSDSQAQATFRPPSYLKTRGITPQSMVKAGSYAVLSELERYQLQRARSFRFDGGWRGADFFVPDWRPLKDPGSPIKQVNDEFSGKRPFDWTYLIGNRSKSDHPLKSAEDSIEMTADKIFMLLVEREQGRLKQSYEANRQAFVLPETVRTTDQPVSTMQKQYARHYGGFGLSKIFIGETVIKRWAAYYLAEQFVRRILEEPPMSETGLPVRIDEIWRSFQWNIQDLFSAFAGEMLEKVRYRFQKLETESQFFDMCHLGVNFDDKTACFESAHLIDAALEKWIKEFEGKAAQDKFNGMLEEWIVKSGLTPGLQVIDAMIQRIAEENELINKNLEDAINRLENFDAECRECIASQQGRLDWLGTRNEPRHADGLSKTFKTALVVLGHIEELGEIPERFGNRVRPLLRDRFCDYFLNDDCCEGWRDTLIRKKQPVAIRQRLEDLKRGMVFMFKGVFKRVDAAQKHLLNYLNEKRAAISEKEGAPTRGTLRRELMDILSHEVRGHAIGLQQELQDLKRDRDIRSRNIYCGYIYQDRDALSNPDPDPGFIATTMKKGFGTARKDGSYDALQWIWDLSSVPDLNKGIKQWTSIMIEERAAELKIKPTLHDYYSTFGTRRSEVFERDLSHCIKTSDSYLRYKEIVFGDSESTKMKKYVFVPENIFDDTQEVVLRKDPDMDVSSYQGKELVIMTIEDGVPLPLLENIQDWHETYKGFEWKGAIWTRPGTAREIFSVGQDMEVEKEIYLGIIIGNIWYDRASRSYKMELERKSMEGVSQKVPLGKSIADVKDFFYGSGASNYESPYLTLKDRNSDVLLSQVVLRRLYPIIEYFKKYYFEESLEGESRRGSSHYAILEEIEARRVRGRNEVIISDKKQKAFNKESIALCPWLHAFCEITPILGPDDSPEPSRDWLPVLARKWNPENSRMALLWHNATFSPASEDPEGHRGKNAYKYAMCATPDEDPEGKELDGWDEEDPINIPETIFRLAWEEPLQETEEVETEEGKKEGDWN